MSNLNHTLQPASETSERHAERAAQTTGSARERSQKRDDRGRGVEAEGTQGLLWLNRDVAGPTEIIPPKNLLFLRFRHNKTLQQ